MSYILNCAFEPRVTNNEFDDLCNITGKYYGPNGAAAADCPPGWLCVRTARIPIDGMSGVYNENAWYMKNADYGNYATDGISALNNYDTYQVSIEHAVTPSRKVSFHLGSENLDAGVPAGQFATFTKINFDGHSIYRFGIGNVTVAVGTNPYFYIEDGRLVPYSQVPDDYVDEPYFKLLGTGQFQVGRGNSFGYVDVLAMRSFLHEHEETAAPARAKLRAGGSGSAEAGTQKADTAKAPAPRAKAAPAARESEQA